MRVFAVCCSKALAPESCASKRPNAAAVLVVMGGRVEYQSRGTGTYRSFVDVEVSDGMIRDLDGRRCLMMMERGGTEEVCGCDGVRFSGGILVRLRLC